MKATGVIVRFLSLLDVALILLGVLMIALTQAQLRSDPNQGKASADTMAALADVDFVYLYAGWKGNENGKCYLLGPNGEIGREVRTETADDIQDILKSRRTHKDQANHVVMLLFSEDGWYSAWDAKKLAGIEQTWKVKLIPIYNARLPQ